MSDDQRPPKRQIKNSPEEVLDSIGGMIEGSEFALDLVDISTVDTSLRNRITNGDRSDEVKELHAEERGGAVLTRLSDVKPEHVQWLWQGRIPVGKLVTLDGDPGLGKSTLALEIAATITTGGAWPDGGYCDHTGAVLLLSAEDGLADTVRPRLDAAGADCTQVHAVEGVPITDEHGDRTLRPPTLADVRALEIAVDDTGARLIVVDVVMAYLPSGTDAHRDQDVRAVLGRLAGLADRTGCSVLLLRHLNKASGRDPLYRGGGSIGIVGAARSGLLVAADPDDLDRRVLASVKSNLGPPPESLAYRLVGTESGVARVQWEGSIGHSAHDLLRPRSDEGDDGAKNEAEQWLSDYMDEQVEISSKAAKADAAKVGIKERTLQRAAHSLGLTIGSRGFPRVTWWALPSRDSTPREENLGATGATGSDVRKHIGATDEKTQSRQAPCVGATDATDADSGPVSMFDAVSTDTGKFPKVTHWRLPGETTGSTPTDGETTETTGADLHKHGETTGELFDPVRSQGETTESTPIDLHKQGLTEGENTPESPVVSPASGERGDAAPPGGITASTPGQTDRVAAALAKAIQQTGCGDGR